MNRWLMLFLLAATGVAVANEKTIHSEKSLYRNIEVKQSMDQRCLVFTVKRGDRNQTCMDLRNPNRVVFPYARMTFAGLLLNPDPKTMLVVGLGGGTIPTVLHQLYPESVIDVVEIDPAVVRVAEDYFDFRSTPLMRVYAQDARVFVKRAGLRDQRYDLVILDAFTGEYIPEHLMTREFLQETALLLGENGVLVANTFSTSRLYDHESVTYANVFGDFFNFKMPITGNRVVLAKQDGLPDRQSLFSTMGQLTARLERYGVHLDTFLPHLVIKRDWDEKARPLTDQYSPANLLRDP